MGLLGPNGAGKTTTFYMITGLVRPDQGEVYLDDQDISALPVYLRARLGINYLPQETSVFRKLTVAENILAILESVEPNKRRRGERLDQLLAELDISALRDQRADSLSGGQKRRLEITRALVTEPDFILLDEPFAGLDPIVPALTLLFRQAFVEGGYLEDGILLKLMFQCLHHLDVVALQQLDRLLKLRRHYRHLCLTQLLSYFESHQSLIDHILNCLPR